jgi:Uma2 family endonuclease
MYNPLMDRPSDMQPARAEPIRFTYEDYLAFPDDGRRHELIDGEHLVTPAPTPRHQELSVRLVVAIANHLAAHPIGKVYAAPLDIILSDANVVEPDIVFVSREHLAIVGDSGVQGGPDLVVEIVSPSSRRTDEVTKRRLFDRFAVREYWVVDPEIEVVKVYRRTDDGAFACAAEPSREESGVLNTPLLPGFAFALGELFA